MTTLDALYQWLFAASLRASLLAFAVLALQLALRAWLPPRWRYALWLPVVLVLIAPSLPSSPLSVENGFVVHAKATPVDAGLSGPLATMEFETVAAPGGIVWWPTQTEALVFTWLLGATLTLGFVFQGYRQSLQRVRRGAIETSPDVARAVAEEARRLGLRGVPEVLVSHSVDSPAITGFFHPLLLLPAGFLSTFSDAEARLVLRHEFTHLARRDLPANWLLCLLQVVHWFNPILWFAFSRIRADREAACDAQVLARESEDVRSVYGHALLKLQNNVAAPGLSLAFVGILERSAGMRARILAIAAHRRPHPAWSWAVTVMIAGLTVLGATRAETNTPAAQIEVSTTFMELGAGEGLKLPQVTSVTDPNVFLAVIDREELTSLLHYENANLLSAPKVTMRDGQKARVEVVRDVTAPDEPGRTKSTTKPAGVVLEVTPKIVATGVSLELQAMVATVKDKKTGAVMAGSPSDWTQATYIDQRLAGTITVPPEHAAIMFKVDPKRVDRTVLVIVTPNGLDPMLEAARKIILKEVHFQDKTIVETLDEIRTMSIESDPEKKGVKVMSGLLPLETRDQRVNLSLKRVSVENALKVVAKQAKANLIWASSTAVLEPLAAPAPAPAPVPEALTGAQKRAQKIVLKEVSLSDAPLATALKTIADLAQKADPAKKGIKISVSGGPQVESSVTLQLKEIPVAEALNYVARISGMELSWTADGAVLAPPAAKP